MYSRLRQVLWILLAFVIGYAAGSGPLAEWVVDVIHMLGVEWYGARIARGPSGTFPLLISGFLLGQGVFLLLRRLIARIGPQRARHTERLAAWDPSLHIARRFGLYRYLEHCAKWAAEDPTTRTQSLALFKIRGLGALNDEVGSTVATQLLQRIAAELRSASLPDSASHLNHWLVRYMPRPAIPSFRRLPFPRYPARWSGSTFALAFRELDAVQAIAVIRDLAAWIRSELTAIKASGGLSLSAVIAVGNANVTARALAAAAVEFVNAGNAALVTVIHDKADLRSETISQMRDVAHKTAPMHRSEPNANVLSTATPDLRTRGMLWLRAWGPAFGCFAATALLLQITGGGSPASSAYFTWPDNLTELQVLSSTGSKTVRLMRNTMAAQSAGGWTLSGAKITQGNLEDGPLNPCQIQLSITNTTGYTYYVSAFDFSVIDAKGRKFAIDITRMLRLAQGIGGRWLPSGETWSGWLQSPRGDAPIAALEFAPDRFTRIELTIEK